MKKIIALCLSMIMLFMLIDFSSIKSIVAFFDFNDSQISSVQLLNTQYEMYEKAKDIVANISDILIHDLQIVLTTQQNNVYIDFLNSICVISIQFMIRTHNKIILNLCSNKTFVCVQKNNICLFLIFLIILFMIMYLGLLRVYWNYKYISNKIYGHIKLLFYMLVLFANEGV